jgi:hypothetical protein
MSTPMGKNRPNDSPFKQQKLRAWQPILTPNWVVGTFLCIAVVFIPVGIVLLGASDNVRTMEEDPNHVLGAHKKESQNARRFFFFFFARRRPVLCV